MLTVSHLCKSFGAHRILQDINLHVSRARRVVIQGHSGCGKTTLLRCLAGLERPDSGMITIDGRKVSDSKSILVAPHERNLGMVFQDLALWPHMTVYQNIAFNLNKIIPDKKKLKDDVLRILNLVKLEHKAQVSVLKLSGGEKQRVAIARTLIRKPKVLLMDEPFSNLDLALKNVLMRLILDLQQKFLITLIYVTHDHDMIEQLADEVVVMDQGRIIKTGVQNEQDYSPRC